MAFGYYKGAPDLYVIKFRNGAVTQHGRGKSFFYRPAVTSILELPATTITVPFIFNEATANFQDVTLQGQASYRIAEPLVTNEQLDFRRASGGRPAGVGGEKLSQMVVNLIQDHARRLISKMPLEDVLREIGALSGEVADAAMQNSSMTAIGVRIEKIHFTSARAQPDVQKALQTEYREKIQRQADMAIYARRSASVENEKEIKERELATEIELATRRKQLVETDAENTIRLAEAEAEADEMKLRVYKDLPPSVMLSLALKDWASRGGTVSNLTVTGDMLADIMAAFAKQAHQTDPNQAGSNQAGSRE